jgi:hypothetical protein
MSDKKPTFLDAKSIDAERKETQRKTPSATQGSLPELVEHIQTKFINKLSLLFNGLLDKADDQLFDLADKAQSNQDQNLYFDSMRELRIKRKGMENIFSQELANNFLKLKTVSSLTDNDKSNLEIFPVEALALVQKDELEENLAIDAMVNIANTSNEVSLRQLITRLDTLIASTRIEPLNNPLCPKLICEAFRTASKFLEFDIKTILVIYKLFERQLITNLGQVYNELNHHLSDSGVLPDLAVFGTVISNKHSKNKDQSSLPSPESTDSGIDILSLLQSINIEQEPRLTMASHSQQQFTTGSMTPSSMTPDSMNSGSVADMSSVNLNQLIGALSSVQSKEVDSQSLQLSNDIRQQISRELTIKGPISSENVGKSNDEIIGIISMLFDFVLGDKNLPDKFKALIARLQIPMLKVALIDESFFRKGSHPARKLINELAHAGVGWTEGKNIGLRDKVETIVNTIIDDYEEDTEIFVELLNDFDAFMQKHQKRAFLIERRLQEAEEGKAKVEAATLTAKNAIQSIVGDIELPKTIKELIFEEWQSVMMLTFLRDGEESEAWKTNLQTVEKLIGSLTLNNSLTNSSSKITTNITKLVKQIKSGLDIVNYDESDSLVLFKELQELHERVLQGERVISIVESNSNAEQHINLDDTALPGEDDAMQVDQKIGLTAVNERQSGKDKTSTGSYFASSLVDSGRHHEDDKFMVIVEGLQTGGWFELNIDDNSSRCKLAAIISAIDKYIFVDCTGKKIAEYLKLDLARAFRCKEISQLDEGSLFDRALTTIVANYRTQKYQADGL